MGKEIGIATIDRFHLRTPQQLGPQWDAYVARHRCGSIFHTSAMQRVFDAAPGHQSYARAAINDRGAIVAMIPAVRVDTLGGLVSPLSSRSLWYDAPLCDATDEGRRALRALVRWHDRSVRNQTVFAEIRPLQSSNEIAGVLSNQQYRHYEYLNYVVDLTHSEDLLWTGISKSTRQHIRRSLRRGVTVEICQSTEAITQAYALIQSSYQRSQVPLAPVELFALAHQHLPQGTLQIRLARYEDQVVAAGFGLVYRDRFYAWYGGSLRLPKINAFDCLTWDEIRWSREHGLEHYDFGGAGKPDQAYGPRDFKAKFGGQLVQYGRYERVYSHWRKAFATGGYRMLRRFLTK